MPDIKIFTNNIEAAAYEQIYTLVKQPAFSRCKIRIMPDVHAGSGCVIGFTANLGDKVIPNIVGVDIGCGMYTVPLGKIDIDFKKLDNVIRATIPAGRNVHDKPDRYNVASTKAIIDKLYCCDRLKNRDWLECSMGTLGGGNHFIEVDEDFYDNKYLIIHTGSRNLGKQVADIYQRLAIDTIYSDKEERAKLIEKLKSEGREKDIQKELASFKRETYLRPPADLCYLVDKDRDDYLHDMKLCQRFAKRNREIIARRIHLWMNWGVFPSEAFHTVHNYIDDENMVRKGAISAKKGERVLIPINMRDGCILGVGKGNPDWNYSAPHGAGRIMSRRKARETVSMDEYKAAMDGIFTTSIDETTIDESPMVYKPMDEIIENIKDTVDILQTIKPIYNFKAGDE